MNFFYLDENPELCAHYMVNSHVVKMILEHCQLLSTTQSLFGIESLYKPTHVNHPCAIWCRESLSNYNLLIQYTKEICKEYTFRYEKSHACESILYYCEHVKPDIKDVGVTKIALAMPDYCKLDNPVDSYRNYYMKEKVHIATWKKRGKPDWFEFETKESL